jgi:lauroyl/myristoyl acyltransferase
VSNARLGRLLLAPDGQPRPIAPFGRGPAAARALSGVIHAASMVGAALPAGAAHALARAGGAGEWAVRPGKRRLLAENLGHAVGLPPHDRRVRALVRHEIANEARRSADLLWALRRPRELRASTRVTGTEHIHEALAAKRGLILSSLHLGGWEVATAIPATVVPVPTTAIVEDDWLAWAIDPFRAAAGLHRLYATAPAWRAAAVLRRGEALLVLGETSERETRRYRVRFLDAEADLPAGLVALSRLCGAPIVPFSVLPAGPRRWHVEIERPLAPAARRDGEAGERRQLQELADRWSAVVRRYPEHWAAVYSIRWCDIEGDQS